MDVFLEKIVARRKGMADVFIIWGIVVGAIILIILGLSLEMLGGLGLGPIIAAGIIYLAYRLITSRNIEYEYIVTNGDLDIDKIISKRKRKRVFSASCKDFEILARIQSQHFNQEVKSITKKIDASSSINSPNAFFAVLNYKGERTVVIFEPDSRMLDNFKLFIPRKIFAD
jgi:hypothetical protein